MEVPKQEGAALLQETQNLINTLNPEKVTDEAGVSRTIYTFQTKNGKAVQALFYSPEEMPFVPGAFKDKQVFLYGQKPKFGKEEDWREYVHKIIRTHKEPFSPLKPTIPSMVGKAIEGEHALFLVEANPREVLDFAFTLGAEGPDLREARGSAQYGRYNQTANQIMDRIIAGKLIDDNGQIRTEKNYEGEVLEILALTGNTQAGSILDLKLGIIQKADQKQERELQERLEGRGEESRISIRHDMENRRNDRWRKEEDIPTDEEIVNTKEFDPNEIALVRLTPYQPKLENDQLVLPSPFDATGGKIPRVTLHFTLNHIVGGHVYGDWTGVPFAIVAPLGKTIDLNRKPRSINAADTYFDLTPGALLKLPPETVVIQPGDLENGQLFKQDGAKVVYKKQNFAPEDIKKLVTEITNLSTDNPPYLNQVLVRSLNDSLEEEVRGYWANIYMGEKNGDQVHEFEKNVYPDLDKLFAVLGETQDDINLLKDLEDKPFDQVMKGIEKRFEEIGLKDRLPKPLPDFMKGVTESKLSSEVQELAIRDLLKRVGSKWMGAGAWGDVHDPMDQLRLDLLSSKLKTPQRPHVGDPLTEVEDNLIAQNWQTRELSINTNNREKVIEEWGDKVPQSARRMLYLTGVI